MGYRLSVVGVIEMTTIVTTTTTVMRVTAKGVIWPISYGLQTYSGGCYRDDNNSDDDDDSNASDGEGRDMAHIIWVTGEWF